MDDHDSGSLTAWYGRVRALEARLADLVRQHDAEPNESRRAALREQAASLACDLGAQRDGLAERLGATLRMLDALGVKL
jgi:hypothetical protein